MTCIFHTWNNRVFLGPRLSYIIFRQTYPVNSTSWLSQKLVSCDSSSPLPLSLGEWGCLPHGFSVKSWWYPIYSPHWYRGFRTMGGPGSPKSSKSWLSTYWRHIEGNWWLWGSHDYWRQLVTVGFPWLKKPTFSHYYQLLTTIKNPTINHCLTISSMAPWKTRATTGHFPNFWTFGPWHHCHGRHVAFQDLRSTSESSAHTRSAHHLRSRLWWNMMKPWFFTSWCLFEGFPENCPKLSKSTVVILALEMEGLPHVQITRIWGWNQGGKTMDKPWDSGSAELCRHATDLTLATRLVLFEKSKRLVISILSDLQNGFLGWQFAGDIGSGWWSAAGSTSLLNLSQAYVAHAHNKNDLNKCLTLPNTCQPVLIQRR